MPRVVAAAAHCFTLQHAATRWNSFYNAEKFNNPTVLWLLQHITTRCNALQMPATHFTTWGTVGCQALWLLQHTATRYNTLQLNLQHRKNEESYCVVAVTAHCNALQLAATNFTAQGTVGCPALWLLQLDSGTHSASLKMDWCVAVCCSVLKCVAMCCSALQCVAAILWHSLSPTDDGLVCCSVVWRVAVCCSVLQCIYIHMQPICM